MNSIDYQDPLKTLAYGLGISLYVDDAGRVTQFGPGKRIEPDRNALPTKHSSPAEGDKKTED